MSDGRSARKSKVVAFIDRLGLDRKNNLNQLIKKAKMLKLLGFEQIEWNQATWTVTGGRLIKLTGKNTKTASFNFIYSSYIGCTELKGEWADVAKALFILRFHRKYQAAPNQRNFIVAISYIAYAANQLNINLAQLTPEALDLACIHLSKDYSKSTAYNLHKAVAEFAGHCDANGLCRIVYKYKYAKMKRPESTGGVGHKRLDDPETLNTKNEKLIDPIVYKIIGELYVNVPKDHKYRFYVLFLTMLLCLGRRFSEISLLPYQEIKKDIDNREYLEYFPRKTSQGDTFTPRRKLYMPSDVLSILHNVIDELDEMCASSRETALEMHLTKGVDLRFLNHLSDKQKLYKQDLEALGIPPTLLDSTGWIRKNNLAYPDFEKLTKQGIKPANPIYYTLKEGVAAYCKKDYSNNFISAVHIDQEGKSYYLKDLLLVRHQGLSSGSYSQWIATQCTHSMMTTFLRYFPALAKEFASSSIEADFTSHHFRHTLNTLLDEGGLSDLLQTEWFGRSSPRETKAYQHTSREKRALMLREDIKKGNVDGKLVEQINVLPINVQDAVHDVGTGICVHNFAQTPCERHLQCSADCNDYVWAKDDKGRVEEQKRQYALTALARETAEQRLDTKKPKKSSDWLAHNDKKLKTLSKQLTDNGVVDFDHKEYLEGLNNG